MTKLGIIDLREGWIGYLRFKPRPAHVASDALHRRLSSRSAHLVR